MRWIIMLLILTLLVSGCNTKDTVSEHVDVTDNGGQEYIYIDTNYCTEVRCDCCKDITNCCKGYCFTCTKNE